MYEPCFFSELVTMTVVLSIFHLNGMRVEKIIVREVKTTVLKLLLKLLLSIIMLNDGDI